MALENLKQNLEIERNILKEVFIFYSQLYNLEKLYPHEKRVNEGIVLKKAIESSLEQIKILNKSIPDLINSISVFKKITGKVEEAKGLVKLTYTPETAINTLSSKQKISVTIKNEDKEKFLEKLTINRNIFKRLNIREDKKQFIEFKKANWYAKISNRFFFNYAIKLIAENKFSKMGQNLRKSNMPYLLPSYLSMMLFSSVLAGILGVVVFIFLLFFAPSILVVLRNLLIIPLFSVLTFFAYYLYPYAEKQSLGSKINQELPFIALHMSAIAGSSIEPSQIFKIISQEKEYPNASKEMRKIINQVNVYGYDLISALKNTARETSSLKFAELLNGMATTISSGGSLSEFLDKRAESLLFEYKLEREKYAKSAETFMDIYISIVIAAPMVLTLLLVLMSVGGIGIGLSGGMLGFLIILGISLINVVFLAYLHLSQPSY